MIHLAVLSRPSNFHAEKWAQALAGQGARVTLFTLDAPTEVPGVEVVQIAPPVSWRGQYRYPSYALTARELGRQLKRHAVDVVHPLHLTPFGSWAIWSSAKPVIAAAMGADVLEYPPNKDAQKTTRTWREAELQRSAAQQLKAHLLNRFYRHQVSEVIRQADLLTGDNQPLVDAMCDWFGAPAEKVRLLRWGLEPERFSFSEATQAKVRAEFDIAPHRRILLSPRGANALYHGDVLIEAFTKLLTNHGEEFDGLHVLMLSAGYSVSDEVRAAAQALTSRVPNFTFVEEQLPRQTVYDIWSLVDLFVSAPAYDGYSAAVAEGRYAGAVPVVNAIPGNLEIITHRENGWITAPFTADQLTEDLRMLVANIDEWKTRVAASNRTWIEQHSLLHVNAAILVGWAEALRGAP